jgi:hypothetical protein
MEPATRKLVRHVGTPPSLPMIGSFNDLHKLEFKEDEDIHSGDQVFFEGLPFHYLEFKDIEENLIHCETHFA